MRRGKDESRSREIKQKAVPCPAQTKEYCDMFHLINKGNGKEAMYEMAEKSRSHNWAPVAHVQHGDEQCVCHR
jgi:hypothetical protein